MSSFDALCLLAAVAGAFLNLAMPQAAVRRCFPHGRRPLPWALLIACAAALPAGSFNREKIEALNVTDGSAVDEPLPVESVELSPPVYTVPLQKQRVPVKSRGQTIFKTIFAGKLTVGTPPQPFTVVFDTGSGHLIVPGETCKSPACVKHSQFAAGNSSTALAIDYDGTPVKSKARDQLTVSFGTGEVTGVFASDVVCVGEGKSLCVEAHLITSTEMTDKPFLEFDFDGVLGLGLSGLSQTPMFNMAQRLGGGNPVFSVFLGEEGSEISFGGYKEAHLASPLLWAPVVDAADGYWKLAVDDVVVDGERLSFCDNGCHAVADTGTSVLAAPTTVVTWIRERLAARLFLRDGVCDIDHEAKIEIKLAGGLTLALDAADYAQPRLNGTNSSSNGTACELLLMRMDVPEPLGPLFILGEPFLTKYYTVFDVEQAKVGFGLAKREDPTQHEQVDAGECTREGDAVVL